MEERVSVWKELLYQYRKGNIVKRGRGDFVGGINPQTCQAGKEQWRGRRRRPCSGMGTLYKIGMGG